MTQEEIIKILTKQKEYFATGATLSVISRTIALKKLQEQVQNHTEEICAALKMDLGKSSSESFMCEIGLVLSEITYMLKHIRKFAKDKTVYTSLSQFPSRSYIKTVPYGSVLIMSPWNYPFLLTMEPLIDALAAGNTCVVKPSAYSPETTKIITKIIGRCFTPELVSVVTGGRAENSCLLQQNFDYIFFTGSEFVGKEVLRQAAENLTPVTLELGGKSPCIVDRSANIPVAARRIVFGKFLNCGQTCVAPDYIYCHKDIKDEFLAAVKKEIKKQFGKNPLENSNYGKIINEKHFQRLCGLIDSEKTVHGGESDSLSQQIAPTVLDNVTWDDAVMGEEIFGPIMPILTFTSLKELIELINSKPHPLAAYYFSENKKDCDYFTTHCTYGGGCVNDTVIHLASANLGFGGIGASGMGTYHGKFGFDTFSHKKSIVHKKTWLDLPMRYQPYHKISDKIVRMFLK